MRKRIQQMHRKLSNIARNGLSGYNDYRKYVGDIITNDEVDTFIILFETKYRQDIKNLTLTELKGKELYNIIRHNTNSQHLEDISRLFNRYNMVYINNIVYEDNKEVGTIVEVGDTLEVSIFDDSLDDIIIEIDRDSYINAYKSAISFIRKK